VWACKHGHIRKVVDLYSKYSSILNINLLFISDQYQRYDTRNHSNNQHSAGEKIYDC
jgi:hypothetical protein